jgi:hypothetical protein
MSPFCEFQKFAPPYQPVWDYSRNFGTVTQKCYNVLFLRLLAFAWALAVSVGSASLTVVADWNFTHLTCPSSYATRKFKLTLSLEALGPIRPRIFEG